jgi:hypothetical protein|tara:strand:- start:165 stop:689 length:525 start_codon:yes stop_codon:yes gene_type:complete
MKTENLERYLNSFANQVVKESKAILQRQKGKTALASSIKTTVTTDPNGYSVKFYMADYGTFVDKGVSGNKTKRSFTNYKGQNESSPYRYTNKQPPSGILDKWSVRKGIAPRDEKGRFIKRKSLIFLIARSIKSKGIQGISFFQKPLGINYKDLQKNLLKEFKEDVSTYITTFTK